MNIFKKFVSLSLLSLFTAGVSDVSASEAKEFSEDFADGKDVRITITVQPDAYSCGEHDLYKYVTLADDNAYGHNQGSQDEGTFHLHSLVYLGKFAIWEAQASSPKIVSIHSVGGDITEQDRGGRITANPKPNADGSWSALLGTDSYGRPTTGYTVSLKLGHIDDANAPVRSFNTASLFMKRPLG